MDGRVQPEKLDSEKNDSYDANARTLSPCTRLHTCVCVYKGKRNEYLQLFPKIKMKIKRLGGSERRTVMVSDPVCKQSEVKLFILKYAYLYCVHTV